ncbi:MAG: hypothetical protein AVDCRST_MAG29-259 [uncultured Nocardioidaceae bacterium]|uniref:Uncharacterized protein n=1 Tax=uncultured Nocardioidaceae bacterium TaxID=253824 RepID=A0A6J4L392_9ACTN|nr:MAG: hypothetical protein AVDCRST_MAG29-259 [uncultured Nocardioidaceae bacterium]
MSTRQRAERGALASLAAALSVGFACCLLLAITGREPDGWLGAGLWGTGLSALLCAFAACRVHSDPADNPEYLTSIARGLRREWQREKSLP